jgi:hypothetical protein
VGCGESKAWSLCNKVKSMMLLDSRHHGSTLIDYLKSDGILENEAHTEVAVGQYLAKTFWDDGVWVCTPIEDGYFQVP